MQNLVYILHRWHISARTSHLSSLQLSRVVGGCHTGQLILEAPQIALRKAQSWLVCDHPTALPPMRPGERALRKQDIELLIVAEKSQEQAKKSRVTWSCCHHMTLSKGPTLEILCRDPWSKPGRLRGCKGCSPSGLSEKGCHRPYRDMRSASHMPRSPTSGGCLWLTINGNHIQNTSLPGHIPQQPRKHRH